MSTPVKKLTPKSPLAERQTEVSEDRAYTSALVMQVPGGNSAEFEAAWEAAAQEVADMPGSIQQLLLRSTGLNDTYVVISKWRDEPTFREFERSAVQDELTRTLRELREGITMSTPLMLCRIEGRNP